ncbi:MAG: endonuclease/exonuclease/phosphatase family protein [Gammaproteobacteria bacterium]|nr:endonuclease/exonuclease/phosphatase family protein [Gammaproteobacteria bacterium]
MKLVTYNIQYGTGRDGKVDLPRIAGALGGADVIALQEVERFWPRSGNVDQARALADLLPEYFWVYGAGVDLHAGGGAPRGARRQFGNMLLCREPLLTSRHHLLPKYGSTGPLSIQRSALEATALFSGRALRFYSVHLTHLSAATRLPQVEALLAIHAGAASEGAPLSGDLRQPGGGWDAGAQVVADDALLLGDFNFQPDSKEYELIAGPLSDYGGRITNPRGFVDAWCAAGNDIAAGFTSDVNGEPARLDYCFAAASLRERITACRVDESALGSDHFPLWTEMDLQRETR